MTKNKGGNLGNAADVSAFIAGAFGLLLVSVFGGVFLQSLVPKNEYQDSQLVANAKEEALSGLSRLRYKGQGANSLPDGKLKQTGAWSASSDTAFEITMEHPASLYLRGFVGSVYDGSSWTEISTEEAYEEKDLYYWLHQEGFYGETQLLNARNLIQDDSLSSEKGIISINNKTASSKYLYTPYELSGLPDGYTGENAQADSTLYARGLFGERTYRFSSLGNLVSDFTTLGAKVYQTLTAGNNAGDGGADAVLVGIVGLPGAYRYGVDAPVVGEHDRILIRIDEPPQALQPFEAQVIVGGAPVDHGRADVFAPDDVADHGAAAHGQPEDVGFLRVVAEPQPDLGEHVARQNGSLSADAGDEKTGCLHERAPMRFPGRRWPVRDKSVSRRRSRRR